MNKLKYPKKDGVNTGGQGPTRVVDGEKVRVRYEGFDYWAPPAGAMDKWTSWYAIRDGQFVLDSYVLLPEGSTLETAEKRLLGYETSDQKYNDDLCPLRG